MAERKPRTINIGGEDIIDPIEFFGPLKDPDDAVIKNILGQGQKQFAGEDEPPSRSLIEQFGQSSATAEPPARDQGDGDQADMAKNMSDLSRDMGQILQAANDILGELRRGINIRL